MFTHCVDIVKRGLYGSLVSRKQIDFAGRKMSVFEGSFMGDGEELIMQKFFDVKPGEVVFDVGAADATWTLFALASGAEVYAFEPSPSKYQDLVADVLANPNFFPRFHGFQMGLDEADAFKTIEQWYKDLGGSEGLEVTPDCLVPCRFLPLDFFLPELSRLDWLKIDVEAGELRVLKGAARAIRFLKPKIILEDHRNIGRMGPWMQENMIWEKIRQFLSSEGYTSLHEEPFCGRGFLVAQ